MTKADCVHSTPPTNTSAITPTSPSRRRFLSQAAGVAAGGGVLALATIPTAATTATSALVLDGTNISQEFRDLVHALQDADEALIAAHAAHDAEYELYREWLKRTPEPVGSNRRSYRKWEGRQKKYMRGSNFYSTQEAHEDACRVHRDARKAVAKYRPHDMNELAHKACLVCVFEGNFDDKPRGYMKPLMAVGVALDLALMSVGVGGGLSA